MYIVIIRISVKGAIRNDVYWAISQKNAEDVANEHIQHIKQSKDGRLLSAEIYEATKVDYKY